MPPEVADCCMTTIVTRVLAQPLGAGTPSLLQSLMGDRACHCVALADVTAGLPQRDQGQHALCYSESCSGVWRILYMA